MASITQWPNWKCVNCHKEFPPDTKLKKCDSCLAGYLVRYKEYESTRGREHKRKQ